MRLSGWVALVAGLTLAACEEKNVCEGVTCEHGACVVRSGAAECLCDFGFELRGGRCVSSDPCASNPCAALSSSLCVVDAGAAQCVCPPSRIQVAGSCVVPSVCLPNPCTGANQTKCLDANGAARCLCDDGFVPGANGCSATPRWDCAVEHAGDPAEPDECPARASTLVNEAQRSLSPAGDTDWFRVAVTPG
ncbi:MAG: hypothetical protein ACO1OB_21430, partial [Archangium sp.]